MVSMVEKAQQVPTLPWLRIFAEEEEEEEEEERWSGLVKLFINLMEEREEKKKVQKEPRCVSISSFFPFSLETHFQKVHTGVTALRLLQSKVEGRSETDAGVVYLLEQ